MKTLGIRTAPQQIRYAIIESDGNSHMLINAETENTLKKPASITTNEAHLKWIKDELNRILRQNSDIDKIALKVQEFGRQTVQSRLGDYMDAMVLLIAADAEIPIVTRLYKQIGTKRADVIRDAEDRVGRTKTHWNNQMADAVVVAQIIAKQ
jgi:hypothetical protein